MRKRENSPEAVACLDEVARGSAGLLPRSVEIAPGLVEACQGSVEKVVGMVISDNYFCRLATARLAGGSVEITAFGISVRHLDRLLGGLLMADSPRLPWAQLLHRIYATDVLACTGCGGRLRLMSAITSRPVARRILEHLGLPAEEVSPRPRSRDPADL